MTYPYQPARPQGLPAGAQLVRPSRPRLFVMLGWVTLAVLLAGGALLTLLAITGETGVMGALTGAVLAVIPVFPVIASFLWLDRYEAEPKILLALAFVWGAGVAAFGALVINTASMLAIERSGGDVTATAVLVAPIVEEAFKGSAVLLILLVRRREFHGVIDGIVYAGMSAIGFAFVENVLYLGRQMAENGDHQLLFVFVLRCVVSPFAHPLFTAATGVGIGLAVQSRNRLVKMVAPIAGYAIAVVLHAIWNATASSGLDGFIGGYIAFQVPVFLTFVALGLYARRREGQLIAAHLTVYGSTGWLSAAEVAMLASLPARREARNWAQRTGGREARLAMRDFQEVASDLAFLRERMASQAAPADAREHEYAMLASLSQLRSGFLPRWSDRQ